MDETRAVSGKYGRCFAAFTDADTRFDALHASVLTPGQEQFSVIGRSLSFGGCIRSPRAVNIYCPEGLDKGSGGAR
jgi:hypothetical protein